MVRGEYIAQDIEDLSRTFGIEIVLNRFDALEQFMQYAAFASVGRNEIKDQAILLLAVSVDSTHALLKAHRIPRHVVINHEPAELQVDTFACCLSRNQHLA